MGIGVGQLPFEIAASQNKIVRTIHNLPSLTPTRDFHMAFKITYLYDFVTKLCRQQATVTLNRQYLQH
jgi:hypothetical protein